MDAAAEGEAPANEVVRLKCTVPMRIHLWDMLDRILASSESKELPYRVCALAMPLLGEGPWLAACARASQHGGWDGHAPRPWPLRSAGCVLRRRTADAAAQPRSHLAAHQTMLHTAAHCHSRTPNHASHCRTLPRTHTTHTIAPPHNQRSRTHTHRAARPAAPHSMGMRLWRRCRKDWGRSRCGNSRN